MRRLLLIIGITVFGVVSGKAQKAPVSQLADVLNAVPQTIPTNLHATLNGTDAYLTAIVYRNFANDAWQNYKRVRYTSFTDDHQPRWVYYDSYKNNDWLPIQKQHTWFDAAGREVADSVWVIDGTVLPSAVTHIYVDGHPALTQYSQQVSTDAKDWVTSRQTTYVCDAAGNVEQAVYASLNDQKAFTPYQQDLLTYAPDGQRLTLKTQSWRTNNWVDAYTYTYSYNEQGRLEQILKQDFDQATGVLLSVYRYKYLYNAANQLTELLYDKQVGDSWEKVNRKEYAYQSNGFLKSITYQNWNGASYGNVQQELYLGVTLLPNKVETSTQYSLQVAPNPAHAAAQVWYTLPTQAVVEAYVLDATGRRVRRLQAAQSQLAGPHTLSVAGALPTGMYVVQLLVNGQSTQTRLVVQ